MPQVTVSLAIPYVLALPEGTYPTGKDAPAELELEKRGIESWKISPFYPGMVLSYAFEAADDLAEEQKEVLKDRHAKNLLRETNRLLRWYRAVYRKPEVVELTLAQASPVRFTTGEYPKDADWAPAYVKEADAPFSATDYDFEALNVRIRNGFADKENGEPALDDLLLVDAQQARLSGKFREAVILSWATIEGSFLPTFRSLVKQFLPNEEEWAEGAGWLDDVKFGLRNKMTVGLRAVLGTSFYNILGKDKWDRLGLSYKCRNGMVHRGSPVSEEEAQQALDVAGDVQEALTQIKALSAEVAKEKAQPEG
jgi:hypothetical protein